MEQALDVNMWPLMESCKQNNYQLCQRQDMGRRELVDASCHLNLQRASATQRLVGPAQVRPRHVRDKPELPRIHREVFHNNSGALGQ